MLQYFLFTIVSFVEYLVAGMSYPDEAVRASVVYILVQLCVRKEDAVLALPLVHTMCRSLSVSLATSRSHELTINLMGEWIGVPIQGYLVCGVCIVSAARSLIVSAARSLTCRDDLNSKWRLLLAENELSRVSLLSRISIGN